MRVGDFLLPERLQQKRALEILHDLGNYLMSVEGHLTILASVLPEGQPRRSVQKKLFYAKQAIAMLKDYRNTISRYEEVSLADFQALADELRTNFNHIETLIPKTQRDTSDAVRKEMRSVHTALWHATELSLRIVSPTPVSTAGHHLVKVNEIVKTTLALVEETAQASSVACYLSLPATKLHLVSGNRTDLSRVLMNLFLNAIQAMPQGGKLSIKAQNAKATASESPISQSWVRISITDTGPGMIASLQDKIFLDNFSTKGSLRGMGLPIARCIVEAHRGSIQLTSAPQKGTTFLVSLPARPPRSRRLKKT